MEEDNKPEPILAEPVMASINETGPEPTDRGMSLIDVIYGLLFAPTATFRKISHRPPLGYAFIVFTAVTLISTLIAVWAPPVSPRLASDMPGQMSRVMMSMLPYFGLMGAVFAFLNWFVLAGVFQLFSEFFGGRGRALGVLAVLGLSELPGIFTGPINLITHFMEQSSLSIFISVSSGLLILIWRFILIVIGLRAVQEYSTGRAVITVLAPGIILFLLAVAMVIAMVGVMIPMINYLPK